MRIKKIHIIRYGPIAGLDLAIGPGLQVIKGRNEAGKTLTVEAVVKMLLKGKVKDFDDMDRVDEEPEGYVLFDDDGKERKVNIKNGLAKYMDLGGLDLRNTFIIRDSDLTMHDEYGYFKNITDKLTGLQLEKIDSVMSSVQDFGRLMHPASDSRLSDNVKYGKVSTLHSQALSFKEEAVDYMKSAESGRLDYLELEQVNARQEIVSIRKKVKSSERALEWARYMKNKAGLEKIGEEWQVFKKLRGFNQAGYDNIKALILKIDGLKSKIAGAAQDQEDNIKKKAALEEKLSKVQGRLDALEPKKSDVDRLKAELDIFNQRKAEEVREPENFSRVITVILLLLAPLSFPAVYIPTRSLLYSFILPVLLLIAGIIIFIVNRTNIRSDKFVSQGKLLENDFKKIGFKIKDLDGALNEIAKFEDGYREIAAQAENLKSKSRLMEMQEKKVSEDMDSDARERKSLELELEETIGKLGISNFTDFNEKRRARDLAASEIIALARALSDEYGGEIPVWGSADELEGISGDMKDVIRKWDEKISASRPQGEPACPEEQAGIGDADELKARLEELERKEDSLMGSLEAHRKTLNDFQTRFAAMDLWGYLDNSKKFDITSLDRLKEAAGIARDFLDLVDRQQQMALEAIRIFESIKDAEETKVSELFEKLNVSHIFEEITGGRYTDVNFDSQEGSILVTDEHGKELPAENLSKGAYDQLFMSVRAAVSEEIMGDRKGFFIIDDAFLSSDSTRLERQFKLLDRLAGRGWSIIYFTVKDEVADLSSKYAKNKIIEM